jgi:hypothetical protein
MLKCYCSKCGAPNEYVSNKPKFCGSCGGSLGLDLSQTIKPPTQNKSVTAHSQITRRFDTEDTQYRHLDPDGDFQFEPIKIEDDRQVFKISDVAQGKKPNRANKRPGIAADAATFMKNFRESAGPSVKPIDINE